MLLNTTSDFELFGDRKWLFIIYRIIGWNGCWLHSTIENVIIYWYRKRELCAKADIINIIDMSIRAACHHTKYIRFHFDVWCLMSRDWTIVCCLWFYFPHINKSFNSWNHKTHTSSNWCPNRWTQLLVNPHQNSLHTESFFVDHHF